MKYIDEAVIQAIAGKGGDGIALPKEKFIPKGGAFGQSVADMAGVFMAIADRNINTLGGLSLCAYSSCQRMEKTAEAPIVTEKARETSHCACR